MGEIQMNYYAKAINILCHYPDERLRILLGKIAEKHPGVLIKANKELLQERYNPVKSASFEYQEANLRNETTPAWMEEVKFLIREEKYIAAIKYYKEQTKVGLREAKEACDKIRDEINEH